MCVCKTPSPVLLDVRGDGFRLTDAAAGVNFDLDGNGTPERLRCRRTAAVNDGGTPGIAMLVTTAVAVALIATGTFQRLVAMASFFLAANYAVCCVALIVLRRREPARVRPFRAWGYPWSAAIVLAGAVAFVAGVLAGDTTNGVAAIALLGAGLAGRAVVMRGVRRLRIGELESS